MFVESLVHKSGECHDKAFSANLNWYPKESAGCGGESATYTLTITVTPAHRLKIQSVILK